MYLLFLHDRVRPIVFSNEEKKMMNTSLWILAIGEILILSPLVFLFF